MPADGVVAPIASFENAARNPLSRPLTARLVHQSTPTRANNHDDDAGVQPVEHSIDHLSILHCNTYLRIEAPWKVAQRPKPPPALGPLIRHHGDHTTKICTDLKKALHIMHKLNIRRMQFRSQEPRICSLGAKSHHLAHTSVYMTLARQASVNGRKSARLKVLKVC